MVKMDLEAENSTFIELPLEFGFVEDTEKTSVIYSYDPKNL
jgi:hypothetical protein